MKNRKQRKQEAIHFEQEAVRLFGGEVPEQRVEMKPGAKNECSMCGAKGKGAVFAPYATDSGLKHNLCERCLGVMNMGV